MDGKIRTDISDPKPTSPRSGRNCLKRLPKFSNKPGKFQRLKELEVAILLGQKRYDDLKPIATASDSVNLNVAAMMRGFL